jgi:hypothetical protein
MSAQLEIVLLDGSQGAPNSTPNASTPQSGPSVAPMPPNAQTAPNQTPQPQAPRADAGRFINDADRARFEEADANYRHENPEPTTPSNAGAIDYSNAEVVRSLKEIADAMGITSDGVRDLIEQGRLSGDVLGPQASTSVTQPQVDTSEPRGPLATESATVQGAIEEITGRVTRALDDLQRKIDEASGTERPATTEASSPMVRRIGGKVLGRLGRKIGRTRTGRALGRIAGSRAGRAIRGRVIGAAATRMAGRAAVGTAIGASGSAATGAAAGGAGVGAVAATVGAVAVPVAVVVAGLGAMAMGLQKVTDAANSLGNELQDLSPEITGARVRAETSRFMDQVDRAQKIGPQVAQIESAQARLSEATYEIQTAIYDVILGKIAPIAEAILDTGTAGVRGLAAVKEGVEAALQFGANPKENREAFDAGLKFAKAINDIFGEAGPEPQDELLMQIFNQEPGAGVRPRGIMPNKKPGRMDLMR